MQNNTISKIQMKSSDNKKARFNWSHDVNTSASMGDLQPVICKLMMPKSKATVSAKNLIRLAPLVAPAFARLKYKMLHEFVAFSDLTENFPHLLAQTSVARGATIYDITQIPHIYLGQLSYLVLIGSWCSIYERDATYTDVKTIQRATVGDTSAYSNTVSFFDTLFNNNQMIQFNRYVADFPGFTGTTMSMRQLCGQYFGNDMNKTCLEIPIANPSKASFFDTSEYYTQQSIPPTVPAPVPNDPYVDLHEADYLLDVEIEGHFLTFAFRLSDFGKRIRKILIGCGYQIDFQSKSKVSLMPLFATFKAYYDMFGLQLYENYYQTNLYKLLTYCDFNNVVDFSQLFTNSLWVTFVVDLGNLWMTNQQDFVSAHIESTAVSPEFGLSKQFIDVDGSANITEVDSRAENTGISTNINGHAFIDAIKHGHLDSEYLKRLYMCTNRNTIAGREIEKLLRAQGLGEFVDNCKSRFIGSQDTFIDVSDVISQADTFKDGTGSLLGEYAGLGVGENYMKGKAPKNFTYQTEEYGYWVCLASIVPDAGYSQAVDGTLFAIDKMSLYNPEFDGLGYEASRKNQVVGAQNWCKPTEATEDNRLDATFGFVPRYTSLKVVTSKLNGNFSLRSTRASFLPYTCDKFIDVGEKQVESLHVSNTSRRYSVHELLTPLRVPVASNVYRYICRYAFLGNFNRIFANVGKDFTNEHEFFDALQDDALLRARFEYLVRIDDNFLIHNVINMQCFAPMKPIERSFETFDENEQPNMAVSKS